MLNVNQYELVIFFFCVCVNVELSLPPPFIYRYGVATPSSGGQVNSMKSKALSNLRWRRVILKISGAALTGSDTCNIDPKVCGLDVPQ